MTVVHVCWRRRIYFQKFDWIVKRMWFAVFVINYEDKIEIQYYKMLKKKDHENDTGMIPR